MKSLAPAAVALVLAACGGDVQQTRLTPALLESPAKLREISNRLEPSERQIFARYLMNRMMMATPLGAAGSAFVTAEGKDPATVAEALAVVRRADALDVRRQALRDELARKEGELNAKREQLNKIAEAAHWAAAPTEAANAVIDEIEALRRDYAARIAAVK